MGDETGCQRSRGADEQRRRAARNSRKPIHWLAVVRVGEVTPPARGKCVHRNDGSRGP